MRYYGYAVFSFSPLFSIHTSFFISSNGNEKDGTEQELEKSNISEFKPVGCFRDRGRRPRPLPRLIANFRGGIDWNNLNKTISRCAHRVSKTGFRYFGIQLYGECWSGMNAERTYYKQGASTRCIYGVGRRKANFVYVFKEKGTFPSFLIS